jgi:branched-chain amino acid transport system substrate-binding protein
VDVIVDLPNSAVALAVNQIVREANKALFVTAAATSRLSGDQCSPNTIHFATDNWTLANVPSRAIVQSGGDSWFYVTADYAFGHDLEKQSMAAVEKAGGKVMGSVRHPFAVPDFSSFLLQAQASKAKVIGFANSQGDFINAVKQAAEFNLQASQKLVGLAVYISDIEPIGLKIAQGSLLAEAFYWDMNDASRAFSRRFMKAHNGRAPTSLQANVYSALMHYFKAVEAGVDVNDGKAIVARMKEMPTDDALLGKGSIRADGRKLNPLFLFEIKKPEESKERFDFYKLVRTIPAEEAFRPMNEGNCPLVAGK